MSRFRFRAWDKDSKKYMSDGKLYIAIHQEVFSDIIEVSDVWRGRFIIEQSTGLKDKNGKEIFEGDVVKTASTKYVVIFDLGAFLGQMVLFPKNRTELMAISPYVEIIGNIYENRELLGVTKVEGDGIKKGVGE